MRISDWSSDVCSSDLVCMDRGLDLAVAGERQCLEQIEPRADDRASHGNAVQHGVEDRQREVARRQTIERDRAAAPDHAERLLERLGRNGGDERSVRAAYRSEERRVGKEGVSTCRYRWSRSP